MRVERAQTCRLRTSLAPCRLPCLGGGRSTCCIPHKQHVCLLHDAVLVMMMLMMMHQTSTSPPLTALTRSLRPGSLRRYRNHPMRASLFIAHTSHSLHSCPNASIALLDPPYSPFRPSNKQQKWCPP